MATKKLLTLASKMRLPQGTRRYQTMVMVGSTNPQGDPSLLATLFVDEKSRLGDVIDEAMMKLRREASHPRADSWRENLSNEDDARHARWEDLNGRKESYYGHNDNANSREWKWDDYTFLDAQFNRQSEQFKNKIAADVAAANEREKVYAAEAQIRHQAYHRFDKLEKQVQDGFKSLDNVIKPIKKDVADLKLVKGPACKELWKISVRVLRLTNHVAFLKEEEELKRKAAQASNLWVVEFITNSINRLPWGLPQVCFSLRMIWLNASFIYPFVLATYVYIRHGVAPLDYLKILLLYHDDLIKPYLEKVEKIKDRKW